MAPKSSLTCCCLENHQSDEVHPHASGACPHDVLGKSAVPCLAVACVIADLEHGRLHVVAPVEFRLRYGLKLLPEHGLPHLFLREVPVLGLSFRGYPPFIADPVDWNGFAGGLVHNGQFAVRQRQVVSRWLSL